MAHDLDGKLAQLVVLAVGQSLRRGDDDALACVDAEGVEVLHVADRDAVVVGVADDLVLHFLPAFEGLLDQNLIGVGKGVLCAHDELFAVVAEARAHAAERVGGADDDGEADLVRGGQRLLDGVDSDALGGLHVDALEHVGEDLAVLGVYYGLDGSPEDAHVVFLKDFALVQGYAAVQRRLSAE